MLGNLIGSGFIGTCFISMFLSEVLSLAIISEDFESVIYTLFSQPCSDFILFSQNSGSSLSEVSVSAVIDTVKCAKEVSLLFEFPGENVELNGLGVKLGTKSVRFLSSIFENVSAIRVSQKEDDRAGVSIINDDDGEFAGREEEDTALGDNKDPDAEDVPPEDLLLDVAEAGNLVWNVDDGEKFASSAELSRLTEFEECGVTGIPREGGVIENEGGMGEWPGP